MALHTDDIVLDKNDGWTEIPLLNNGTFVQIIEIKDDIAIRARIGSDSNSVGITMKNKDQLKAPQSIYAKTYSKFKTTVIVIRDGDE